MFRNKLKPQSKIQLLSPLGEGLNARVFRGLRVASDGLPAQSVALKVFTFDKFTKEFESRFQKLSQVRSKYCAGVLGWEKIQGQTALIMDLVDGVTLYELALRGLHQEEISLLIWQIHNALYDLNEFGTCHGDLSPHNIMVDTSGMVKLIDYGMGQTESSDTEIIGSPFFLSPERWSGRAPDLASDLFALGILNRWLESPFSLFDIKTEQAKELSNLLAQTSPSPFLSMNPTARLIELAPSPKDSEKTMKGLAVKVRGLLNIKKVQAIKTTVVKKMNTVQGLVKKRAIASLFILCSVPQISGGKNLENLIRANPADGGTLEFRSEEWLEIELNGEYFGFAPTPAVTLEPGVYMLKWKTQSKKGVGAIKINKGEHKIITSTELPQNSIKL